MAETAPFPSSPSQMASWICGHPMFPQSADPDDTGRAFWPYVSRLLNRRHNILAHFHNAAVGSTGVLFDWNGRYRATGNDAGTGDIAFNGSTVTTVTGGLDGFSAGQNIRVRGTASNDGQYTVSGTPTATSLTITGTFPANESARTQVAIHGPAVNRLSPGWDPNGYYASASAALAQGRFDERYAIAQWGNRDFNARMSRSDVEQELGYFADFWRNNGADGCILGGTLLNASLGGTVYTTGQTFMRDAWMPACENLAAAYEDVFNGAHMGAAVGWYGTPWYKSDNTHFNYDMNYLAAELWYEAIATMLGFTPSTEGRVYESVGESGLIYPSLMVS